MYIQSFSRLPAARLALSMQNRPAATSIKEANQSWKLTPSRAISRSRPLTAPAMIRFCRTNAPGQPSGGNGFCGFLRRVGHDCHIHSGQGGTGTQAIKSDAHVCCGQGPSVRIGVANKQNAVCRKPLFQFPDTGPWRRWAYTGNKIPGYLRHRQCSLPFPENPPSA